MTRLRNLRNSALLALCAAAPLAAQGMGGSMEVRNEAAMIKPRIGAFADKSAQFVDSKGNKVSLAEICKGDMPVLLNPQYFRCPGLCGAVMGAMVRGLKEVGLTIGKDYRVVSLSFDPREGLELAAQKKANTIAELGNPAAADHWQFWTGDKAAIDSLCQSVGFGFLWNETRKDFDHAGAIVLLNPDGKINRYLRVIDLDNPRTFRLGIVEAGEGKVGTFGDQILLSCYSYDPVDGTYSKLAPAVMAIGAALTLLFMVGLLFVLWRRERRQVAPAAAS